jgi:hypothetical protein
MQCEVIQNRSRYALIFLDPHYNCRRIQPRNPIRQIFAVYMFFTLRSVLKCYIRQVDGLEMFLRSIHFKDAFGPL